MKHFSIWLGKTLLPPLVLLFCVVTCWHLAVAYFDPPVYLIPGPWRVVKTAIDNGYALLQATVVTAICAAGGLACGIALGSIVALCFSQSSILRRSLYPYAIFLQTVPIVAIAPLIIIWLGTGFISVIVISLIICLFPIITNGTTGLLAIDPDLLELFAVNNASRWQILCKLRLPHSVPHFITGARISSGLSVIGAIVGEFFAGYSTSYQGLGYLITLTSGQLKTDYLFAAIFMSTLLGLSFFAVISLIGEYVLRKWHYA